MYPQHNTNAPSNPPACRADAACVSKDTGTASATREAAAAPAASGGGARVAGAQPSITAPANSIRPYRHGVDSLYLSFPGAIDPQLAMYLQEGKLMAQSPRDDMLAMAGACIGDHFFTVLPRGRGRFAFVIEDGWFSIQLSNASAGILPLAMVQVRSEYLTAVGAEEAVATVTELVENMGEVTGPAKISRIDVFADFGTDLEVAAIPGREWVKRSKKRAIHEECDEVTGISFGAGNEVSARMYDKTREILKSGKDYMRPLWTQAGWDGVEQIWRMEFQVRREGLPEPMRGAAAEALPLCGNLWRYLCEDWLRLAIPSDSDETRSRWPTHPLWESVAKLWDTLPDAPPMTRVTKGRPPSDDRLFRNGMSGLSGFMAREGITDYGEALGEFLHAMERYYESPARSYPESVQSYMGRKARTKARRYNTWMGNDGQA
jgi:hypothetical protein